MPESVKAVSIKTQRLTLLAFVLCAYILAYEWRFLEYHNLLTNGIKLAAPLLLLASLPYVPRLLSSKRIYFYNALYLGIILYSIIPSALSPYALVNIVQTIKFSFIYFFWLFLIFWLYRYPELIDKVAKGLIIIGILTLIQYTLGQLYEGSLSRYPTLFPGMYKYDRLNGFFYEPSNASAYMFAMYFISRSSSNLGRNWRWAGSLCLLGGFLCLSNAGYLAFAIAAAFGLFRLKTRRNPILNLSKKAVVLIAICGLIILGLAGRFLTAMYYPDSILLRNITGLQGLSSSSSFDKISGYRISTTESALSELADTGYLGVGMRIPGVGVDGALTLSGGAPVEWLVFLGPFGLFLFLLKAYQVIKAGSLISNSIPEKKQFISLQQAWIVYFVQESIYGSWISPIQIFLAAAILVTDVRLKTKQKHLMGPRVLSNTVTARERLPALENIN